MDVRALIALWLQEQRVKEAPKRYLRYAAMSYLRFVDIFMRGQSLDQTKPLDCFLVWSKNRLLCVRK